MGVWAMMSSLRGSSTSVSLRALMLLVAASGCASTRDQRGAYLDVIRADQRPPLVGARAAADSLFGPAEECERGDGIAESRRAELEALVRRFAPTLILPSGDNIGLHGRRAQLLPIHPLLFADTLRLDRVRAAPYQLKDFQDLPFRGLSLDSLAQLVELGLRSQSDPELLSKVEKLIAEDQNVVLELDAFRKHINDFARRASQIKKDEAQVAADRTKLEQEGLALILRIKRQRATADTWLAEANYRDRGPVD